MSGWFGTSNPEVDSVFNGIQAGYARRRNAQRQRHNFGRVSVDQRAFQNRNPAVSTNNSGATKQRYLGYELNTRQFKGQWITSVSQGLNPAPRNTAKGRSKGESVNAAKNWVDSQVTTKVSGDPNIKKAQQVASKKAAAMANKIVKQDTDAMKKQAFREAEQKSAVANRIRTSPVASPQEKMQAFREAEAAAAAAERKAKAAQASEAARFAKIKQAQEQKLLNEEIAKRNLFTESSAQSVTTSMTPSIDPGEVARFNREKARQAAERAFTPVRMPRDFTAGSYTVRAAYNPTLQNYVVNVFQGQVNKEKKTFSKNEGAGASIQHKLWTSLATKKAKYDTEESKIFTRGGRTVELIVTKSATLSGFLDTALSFLGLGKVDNQFMKSPIRKDAGMFQNADEMPRAHIWEQPRYGNWNLDRQRRLENRLKLDPKYIAKQKLLAEQGQEKANLIPRQIKSRTQAFDQKIKEFDQVVSKPAVSNPTIVAYWASMPTKSFSLKLRYGMEGRRVKVIPFDSYEAALKAYNAAVEEVKTEPVVDATITRRIDEARSQDGSGGAITDPAAQAEKIQQFKEASEASIPVTPAIIPVTPAIIPVDPGLQVPEQSENYDEMVQVTEQEKLDHFHEESRASVPAVYPQPVSTYQAMTVQDNQWVQAESQAAKNTDKLMDQQQLLGVGILALAGAMYYSRK